MTPKAMTPAVASTWIRRMRTMTHKYQYGPTAEDLLELFGGRHGRIYPTTLQEYRHRVVAITGIDLPYGKQSLGRFLDCGGEERVLEALADVAEGGEGGEADA